MQEMVVSTISTSYALVDQGCFRETITRERKRSERSGRAMVLLVISVRANTCKDPVAGLDAVAKAVSSIKCDMGTLGWFESGRSIGLLIPEVSSADSISVCNRLTAECREAVSRECDEDHPSWVSIKLCLYPIQIKEDECVTDLMNPFLYPELSTNRKAEVGFQALKRGIDIVLSLCLLFLLSPLFLVLAGLVKLSSPGPIYFHQVRVGYRMKPFTMYKFRSMYVDSEHQAHHSYISWFIASSDQAKHETSTTVFKLTNDDRITRIGHLLRRTSLDELPQLWNVLRGDMSLVGPRPALPYEVQQYKPWHRERVLEAKPGITGLWQVVGRSRTTFDEMVRLDLQYARTMSLWTDVKILLATPAAVITGKGAC
jgi:lipopolysaccharide/colanic/teichoic acid biosynthesis glycosyltransferase